MTKLTVNRIDIKHVSVSRQDGKSPLPSATCETKTEGGTEAQSQPTAPDSLYYTILDIKNYIILYYTILYS